MEFTNTSCHTTTESLSERSVEEVPRDALVASASPSPEGQCFMPSAEQTIGEHIASAASASNAFPPPVPLNQAITGLMVERLLEDAAFEVLTKQPGLATSQNRTVPSSCPLASVRPSALNPSAVTHAGWGNLASN